MSRRGRKQEVELRKARKREEKALELPHMPKPEKRQLVAKRTPSRGAIVEVHGRRYVGIALDRYRQESGSCCPFCSAIGQWVCTCGTVNVDGDDRCRVCTGRRAWAESESFDR